MKASIHLLAAMACLATAQKMADAVPACAVDCLNNGIKSATKCALDDGKCICEVNNYRNTYDAATACVLQACGAAKSLDQVLPAAAKFCSEVTGGATAPPVDDSAPATTSKAAAAATDSAKSSGGAAQTSASGGSTTSASAAAAATTSSTGAAPTAGPLNSFAVVALGLAALI